MSFTENNSRCFNKPSFSEVFKIRAFVKIGKTQIPKAECRNKVYIFKNNKKSKIFSSTASEIEVSKLLKRVKTGSETYACNMFSLSLFACKSKNLVDPFLPQSCVHKVT